MTKKFISGLAIGFAAVVIGGCTQSDTGKCMVDDRLETAKISTLYAVHSTADGFVQFRFSQDAQFSKPVQLYVSQGALAQLDFYTGVDRQKYTREVGERPTVYKVTGWVFDSDPCDKYPNSIQVLEAVRELSIEP